MIFFERIHCGIPTVDDPMLNTPWSNNYGIPVAWHTTQTIFLSFSIVALGNFLVIASQLKGVTVTIRLIRSLSAWFPLETGRIDDYSMHTDRLIKKWPFLFLCHKQICLIRGLLLFFYGKRRNLDVRLNFGSRRIDHRFDTHCWIIQNGVIRFEVEDVIRQYTILVEYA
jgi:hypothetical protein